jgi:hypothetical protein
LQIQEGGEKRACGEVTLDIDSILAIFTDLSVIDTCHRDLDRSKSNEEPEAERSLDPQWSSVALDTPLPHRSVWA